MEHDEILTIRQALGSIPAVAALVGSRIYAESATPPKSYTIADGPCICFATRGGDTDEEEAIKSPSLTFKFYASDQITARQLYLTAHEAMTTLRTSRILSIEREALGITLFEPESNWPFVQTYYRILIRNKE